MCSQRANPASKGSYVLIIQLPREQLIAVGSLKGVYFPRGYYAYVGSALGGFKSRLRRHLQRDKRPQWHIDYLLQKATVDDIIICQGEDRYECTIAQALGSQFKAIPGFGSSDCRCHSHLFMAGGEMKSRAMEILNSLGLEPILFKRQKGLQNDRNHYCQTRTD